MIVLFGYSTWRPAVAIRQSPWLGVPRQRDLNVEIDGCDISPQAIHYAQGQASARGVRVKFFVLDALREDFHRTMMFCAAPCSYIILVKRTQSPC